MPCRHADRRLSRPRAARAARLLALGLALFLLLPVPAFSQKNGENAAPPAVTAPSQPAGSATATALAPPPAETEAKAPESVQKSAYPKIFGTVSFRLPLKKQENWLSVLRRNAEAPIFAEKRQLSRSTTWGQLRDSVQGLPLLDKLRAVNRFWNAWPYRSDLELWKKQDYWATPAEFLRRSGDCEDYCIAKYFTLRELGVPADDLRIVVVTETIRGRAHAVLVVFRGQEAYVLDNLSEAVRPMRRVRNYRPHFSVNENGRWMHVQARTPAKKSAGVEKKHENSGR